VSFSDEGCDVLWLLDIASQFRGRRFDDRDLRLKAQANTAFGNMIWGKPGRSWHSKIIDTRSLDRRSRDRAYEYDSSSKQLRSQFKGVSDWLDAALELVQLIK